MTKEIRARQTERKRRTLTGVVYEMMLEVNFRPTREDDLEGGLGAGFGRGLGYAAIFVLVDDSVRILPAK
jgi:hypothetical protein